MENTTRDRTEEHRDRDNTDGQAIPPPRQPAPNTSGHVPGGATGVGGSGPRFLQGATDVQKKPCSTNRKLGVTQPAGVSYSGWRRGNP